MPGWRIISEQIQIIWPIGLQIEQHELHELLNSRDTRVISIPVLNMSS